MLPQYQMIDKMRSICLEDDRLIAAMLYGSFTIGEGDAFSDVEALFFFDDAVLPTLDRCEWVNQLDPVLLFFADDFGHYTAIFENLIRGEFHFNPASKIGDVAGWRGNVWFASLDSTLLADKQGTLAPHLQQFIGSPPQLEQSEATEQTIRMFLNLFLFGNNVLSRGEYARSLEILSMLHRHLLKMARLVEHSTDHWVAPARKVERELSPESYQRFISCTATADPTRLRQAFDASWQWGTELTQILIQRYQIVLPGGLFEKISEKLQT